MRTSSTAWCDHTHCGADPVLSRLRARIANLTLVPERNAEHLQVPAHPPTLTSPEAFTPDAMSPPVPAPTPTLVA